MKGRKTTDARQLALDLPHIPAMGADDFITSDCNREAREFIGRWPDWPSHAGILAGPAGSGKSHLGSIWKDLSGARAVKAPDIAKGNVKTLLEDGALLIEDAHLAGLDEAALFHAFNWAGERGGFLLITARTPPGTWNTALPDLISRLKSTPLIELHEPDDALLCMVLVKLFADRQLPVDAKFIDYLTSRMERSLASAVELVDRLDKAALAQKRSLTRPLAAKVLNEM